MMSRMRKVRESDAPRGWAGFAEGKKGIVFFDDMNTSKQT